MANTQTIKTKIALKLKTLAEWQEAANSSYVPLRGEVCLCEIPNGSGEATTAPTVLFKVGDGEKPFSELDWVSAKAADVYGWAKAEKKPTYDKSEIGLSNVLNVASYSKSEIDDKISSLQSSMETDTDTQYQLVLSDHTLKLQSKTKDGSWADVAGQSFTLPDTTYTFATGSVNGSIAVDGEDVPVKGLGSAAYTESNKYATADQGAKADSAVQASDFEEFKTSNTAAIADAKKAGTDAAGALTEYKTTNDKAVSDEVAAREKVEKRVESLETSIGGLTGAMHFKGAKDSLPASVEGYSSGDVIVITATHKEYVCDGTNWIELGDEGSHATKDYVDNKVSGKVDKVEGSRLMTNDEGTKLAGIAANATKVEESTVSDWGFTKNTGTVNKITINGEVKTITSGAVDLGAYLTEHQSLSGKQDALNATQLGAVNSGVTATKVATYDGYASKISTLEGKAGLDKVGTVTSVAAGVGLKVTGTSTVAPKVEIDTDVIFILDANN